MEYDIIVIGAGSGGLNIASFMNRIKMKVLLIDKTDKDIGGDCLNYGCVPSKALIHISKLIHDSKKIGDFGFSTKGKTDMKKVVKYIKSKQNVIREHENASYFRKQGMDVVLGEAKFFNKNTVEVKGKKYQGKKIVIATGSRPRKPNIQGIEKIPYLTNETIFDIKFLPKNLVVIGGGPIGMELAQAFKRLGSSVKIIAKSNKVLPKEDSEITNILKKQFEKEGIDIYFNSFAKKFDKSKGLVIEQNNKNFNLICDTVLVSIGRELNIDNLDLDKANIKTENNKIIVDDYLRTTNKNVLVCGDAVGSYMFTHAAELHAGIILSNFFSPIKKKINYDKFSWVTYTSPEIATFGLNESQLKNRKIPYKKLVLNFKDDDRAIVDDNTYGKTIIYVNKKEKILGGSMIAENAGELFQELSLVNTSNLSIKNIFNKIYPYPTASRVNKKIISNHFSNKLTSKVKEILRFMYKFS